MTGQPQEAQRAARPHTIIVVGGGAGGLELATTLGDRLGKRRGTGQAQVVLVDWHASHIWKPLLHEVAAGSMDPNTHQLAYAAQALWHDFEFQQGELLGLDRAARTIRVGAVVADDGIEMLPQRELHYDTLVLAIGSVTNFFGVPGTAEHALALDTAAEADRFRRRLLAACMRAESRGAATPGQRPTVSVAIIGAGATGVELSAELRNTAEVLSAYGLHDLDPRHDIRIHVVEAGPRVLPALPLRVSSGIVALLRKLDVDVLTDERVTEVTATSVLTASGKTIPSDLTVWAAGITAPGILATLDGLAVSRSGQIVVRQTLQSETDADIFAMGDCASCLWVASGGTVPPRAQAAHQQAQFLARALRRRLAGKRLPEFHFQDFGSLVSLGHFSAVGNLMGGLIGGNVLIEGLVARVMYQSLYRMHMLALHGYGDGARHDQPLAAQQDPSAREAALTPAGALGQRRGRAGAQRPMFIEFVDGFGHGSAFARQEAAHRLLHARIAQPVRRLRAHRVQPAGQLVRSLGAALEDLQALFDRKFDHLVIAAFKMQAGHVFERAPVAPIKHGAAPIEHRQGAGDGLPVAMCPHQHQLFGHVLRICRKNARLR